MIPSTLRRGLLAAFIALAGGAGPAHAQQPAEAALSTLAERSGFVRTGRYEEVTRLCAAYAARWPQAVRCEHFGQTPEGRPMLALVVSRSGALTPAAAQQRGLPVLLVQAGIHAGEIDGKDAGFLALRQMLEGQAGPGALDKLVLVFVPVFNVDGHERFGRWNRPNQIGPEEMGWRTTAQNLNLNRDYMKADAPEMQAMLHLMNAWDPLLLMDLHVTDGAKFEHDVSIQVEPLYSGDAELRRVGLSLRDGTIDALTQQGSLPLPFYPSFVVEDDPASGFEDGVAPPRFSTSYPSLSNRFGMLVETHAWKDYATRVRVTRNSIVEVVQRLAREGARWRRAALDADQRAQQLAGSTQPLGWKASDKVRSIDFRGYAYTREPSAVSGALMTRYDDTRPQVWHLPLRDDVQPALQVAAPRRGYLIPAAEAGWMAPRLADHGLRFERLERAQAAQDVQVFRASAAQYSDKPFEGRTGLSVDGAWNTERRALGAGALFVPIAQPRARLAMALLEPQAPDSYLAWGFFNNAFEAKEYMEAYVAEDVARTMLARDPELARAFTERLASDAPFALSPEARLAFFSSRHPSHDERLNLYPVVRLDR